MRFQAYAGASVALATSVILKALHERANFYSASVYLAQSNACIMILTNLVLLVLGCILLGLQKLLYGPLRPIEIEQLYEKAWFAITETCLAMTLFRDDVGAWFIVMFVSLLVGKIWGWIGEGRVEILEQQPPSNPRLFHARLSSSLALSFLFNSYFLNYSISTVRQQARPSMMVMFAFEFAVLTVMSMSTCARYGLSLREAAVIKKQTARKIHERKAHRLQERTAAAQQAKDNGEDPPEFPPLEEEIDELDIDVPGWEEKGRWAFYLDLATDFLKLILYLTFFCVLCIFYGMPIHIIRDVALTVRSFYNRVTDFVKYRHATRDMNKRYPDATAEEIQREDTCIICREPMRPWQPLGAVQGEGPATMEERLRPKKLPCGHILHFACLRSWLERQQKCPTCRQDVFTSTAARGNQGQTRNGRPREARNLDVPRQGAAGPIGREVGADGGAAGAGGAGGGRDGNDNAGGNRGNNEGPRNLFRTFNLGPARIGIGFGAGDDVQRLRGELRNQMMQDQERPNNAAEPLARQHEGPGVDLVPLMFPDDPSEHMEQLADQLSRQSDVLNLQRERLHTLRNMQQEFRRLSTRQDAVEAGLPDPGPFGAPPFGSVQGYGPASEQQRPLGHGDPGLPLGVSIPQGWHLMPLTPMAPHIDAENASQATASPSQGSNPAIGAPRGIRTVTSNAGGASATANDIMEAQTTAVSNGTIPHRQATPPSVVSSSLPILAASAQEQSREQPTATASNGNLPNWTSEASSSQAPSQTVNAAREDGEDANMSSPNSHAHADKGKQRAPTVEDAPEEDEKA